MKKLLKALLIIVLLLVLCLVFAFVLLYGPNFGIYLKKPDPQQYVQQAVKYMDTQGIYSDTGEWNSVREETLRQAEAISSYEESYPLLQAALKAAGGKHSKLIPPKGEGENPEAPELPEWELRSDGILTVHLPAFTGNSKEGTKYAKAVNEAIKQNANVMGIIIDLRGNTGGDMGPMVAAVSSLLDDGVLMNFGIQGTLRPVTLSEGCVSGGGSTVTLDDPFKVTGIPVAILQDEMTASSAEATLLCFRGLDYAKTFGTATAGYCSTNNVFKLYNGAQMLLTIGTDIARTGETFCEDPIAPDVESSDPETTAAQWIHGLRESR